MLKKDAVRKAKSRSAVSKSRRIRVQERKPSHSLEISILYLLGLLIALSSALPAYVQSNFLNGFVSVDFVSIFFVIANLACIIFISLFPKMIKRLGNFTSSKLNLAFYGFSLFLLVRAENAATALLGTILFTVFSNLIWINMDVLLESFSQDSRTGRIRTSYFTAINAGWIFAPWFSSYLIGISGYTAVFFVAGCLVIPAFLILLAQERRFSTKIKYDHEDTEMAVRDICRDKDLRGIFLVAILLQVFYSTAVVYVPLYLHQYLGIGWSSLGLIFSFMLLPFVIFEIPAGIIADKRLGEKEILIVGFSILIISLILFGLVRSSSVLIWGGLLFFSRIGASLVEAMRETYFFKKVDVENVSYINVFRMAAPLGYIITPLIALPLAAFLPISCLFLVIAAVCASGIFFAASLKDTL